MKHDKFIKNPIKGDIVKVYHGTQNHSFGIFQRIERGIKTENGYLDEPGDIAILVKTKNEYDLSNINFFFNDNVVRFTD